MPSYVSSKAIMSVSKATIGSIFHFQVPANPDHRAIVDGERIISYTELEDRTNRLAQVLLGLGLEGGDRVGILAHNCAEFIELELAAAKAGIIVAALNWRLGDRELNHCIRLVEPKLIITQGNLVGTLDRLDLPEHLRIILGKDYEQRLSAASCDYPNIAVDPEDGLFILYTSGTTGLPKGALISHRAMIARAMCFTSEMEVPVGDNFVAWPPLYHMASTDKSITTLLRGGTVFVVDGYQPDILFDLIECEPMRVLTLMPGMVGDFVEKFKARGTKVKSVGLCGAMADLVPPQDIADVTRLLNAPFVNTFGSTETGVLPASSGILPIGIPPTNLSKRQNAFCEMRLVDPDDNEVPVGTPGEVAMRGPTVFSGYWNADETNAEDFRNGWFHMGDVMRRNTDGTLDYVDRVKYMIKSGGENIYPAEIEQVIKADPRVTEAVIVRKRDDKWGEVPVAFVVRTDDSLTADEIHSYCKTALSSYKRPQDIIFTTSAELPRSTTGKIQRHELEARLTINPADKQVNMQ